MKTIIDGKYILRELIGSGGMANVYRAETVSEQKIVAVKILKEECVADKELKRRFEKEAKAMLRLHHENIVRAYDTGEYENAPYIVLEYVEGRTVKTHIEEQGHLTNQEATAICCQILDALEAAHAHGIIHRDIKPDNVILNERGVAKLTDFGIAREASASTMTFNGKNVIGSVHYISPEQAQGDPSTEASDIYSTGITLYEMLTGDVPFRGETVVATAIMQINDMPKPPQLLEPDIPDALNAIVMKAIEKDPEKRYKTAREMRNDLVRSLSDPSGSFISDNPAENLQENGNGKRKKLFLTAIMALIFIPIAALAAVYIGYRNKSTAVSDALNQAPVTETMEVSLSASAAATAEPAATPAEPEPSIAPDTIAGMRLDEALLLLSRAGAERIYVYSVYDAPEEQLGLIVSAEKAEEPGVTAAKLSIARGSLGKYKADISFTVDVPVNNASVKIVYKTASDAGIEYNAVLYETTAVKENNVTFSATVYSADEATRTVFLLINGEEIRSQDVKFS